MSCPSTKFRYAIKRGSGVPTVPASADHTDQSWLATDIYEGEYYMDTDTGFSYTRNGAMIVPMFAGTPPTGTITNLTFADTPHAAGSYETMLVNATGGKVDIDLPTAVGKEGQIFVIKKIDGTENTVDVNAFGAEGVEGVSTFQLALQLYSIRIVSNGANWFIVESNIPSIVTFATLGVFPTVGMEFVNYIDLSTGIGHYWDGAVYEAIAGKYLADPVTITTPSANFNSATPTNVPDMTYTVLDDGDFTLYAIINMTEDAQASPIMYYAVNGVTVTAEPVTITLGNNEDDDMQGTWLIEGLIEDDIITVQLDTLSGDVDLEHRRMVIQSWT